MSCLLRPPIRQSRRFGLSPAHLIPVILGASPPPDESRIRRQLGEIFERPEFTPESGVSLPDEFRRALDLFFKWLGSLSRANPALYWILLTVCVTLLVVLSAHILWTLRQALFVTARPDAGVSDRSERIRRSIFYQEEAHRRSAGGDYTEAIRSLFLSLVYLFDESGRVSFQRAYTNREYLALFRDRPQVHRGLQVFVETLDQYWYGERPTDALRYQECLGLYESLK